jgi:hypothetical protein
MTSGLAEGWHKPENSRKWHYYTADRRSLCRKWVLLFGRIDEDNQTTDGAGKADCAACAAKLAKRQAAKQ